MTNQRGFWLAMNVGLAIYYTYAAFLFATGTPWTNILVLAAILILGAHVLEIPVSMKVLRDKNPAMGRLLPLTILFGLTWWVPAKKGIFAVR
jgi:uncharacterized membrane protein HdeD (DUF308 family)